MARGAQEDTQGEGRNTGLKAMRYSSRYDRQSIFAIVRLTEKSAIPTEHRTLQSDLGARIRLASLQAIIHKETSKTESHHTLKAMLATVFVLQILGEHSSDSHTPRSLCLRPWLHCPLSSTQRRCIYPWTITKTTYSST